MSGDLDIYKILDGTASFMCQIKHKMLLPSGSLKCLCCGFFCTLMMTTGITFNNAFICYRQTMQSGIPRIV